MDGYAEDELLATARVRRGRSPLFLPLLLLSLATLGLVGYRAIVPLLNEDPMIPLTESPDDEEVSPWQCRSVVERAGQLPSRADAAQVWLPTLMARSQLVVSGKVTDGLLYDDYGVAVVEV